jgi:hypothetical protein
MFLFGTNAVQHSTASHLSRDNERVRGCAVSMKNCVFVRLEQDASSARVCCFDQKEESSLIGLDLLGFLLFQSREQQMLVESPRDRSTHKHPLPT